MADGLSPEPWSGRKDNSSLVLTLTHILFSHVYTHTNNVQKGLHGGTGWNQVMVQSQILGLKLIGCV